MVSRLFRWETVYMLIRFKLNLSSCVSLIEKLLAPVAAKHRTPAGVESWNLLSRQQSTIWGVLVTNKNNKEY